MLDAVQRFFSEDNFMPHGMCYLWQPGVLWFNVVSDALITLAYFSIPFTLVYFVRRRKDLQFDWMFICFAIFIVACGTTHFMGIWVVWHPAYWLAGGIKAVTALASVPTAILLVKLVPQALRFPSPAALEAANAALQLEVTERKRAEGEVRRMNEELEIRVVERTRQLETLNANLRREVLERERMEAQLRVSEVQLRADLAERQRAEEAARSAQALLQAIIDNSTAVIYVKDLQGRYLLINRRYEEIFQLDRNAVIGRTDHDFFSKDVADAFREMDARVAKTGAPLTDVETAPQIDGNHVYISVKGPLRDGASRIYGVFGISTDITDQKRNEEYLRSQVARLHLLDQITRAIAERQDLRSVFQVVVRSLEDHMPIDFGCACLYDSAHHVLTVTCVGVKSQALVADLALPEQMQIKADENGLARCVRGQLVYEADITDIPFPFPARLAHGGLRSLVFAPLLVEGSVFGILVAARRQPGAFTSGDCEFLRQLSGHVALAAHQAQLYGALQRAYDDLRQTQQTVMQQERLRALGQMASGIAHDINNALSPASLYVQMLVERDESLGEEARNYLTVTQRAIEDVANTVARMREFSRPREPQVVFVPVDLNAILQQVIDLTHARWSNIPQEQGVLIRLEREFRVDLPQILGAESEIRDALTNLVLNAADAMPEGGTLTLRSRLHGSPTTSVTSDSAAALVAIEVSDTGVGMSESVRTRCLEPFFTTKGERGTGLGLAMVYGMTRRHNAELEIDSEPGVGTTVRLVFPVTATGAATVSSSAPQPLESLRILIVDDDPLLLRSLQDTLGQEGHLIQVADGGQAGIDVFSAARNSGTPIDVVITDLGMPHIDGRTVATAVKSLAPLTPVILLTGWGYRLRAEGDVPLHVDCVLSKPPKLAELRAALAELTETISAPRVSA